MSERLNTVLLEGEIFAGCRQELGIGPTDKVGGPLGDEINYRAWLIAGVSVGRLDHVCFTCFYSKESGTIKTCLAYPTAQFVRDCGAERA